LPGRLATSIAEMRAVIAAMRDRDGALEQMAGAAPPSC
jgi:hypothetical protein